MRWCGAWGFFPLPTSQHGDHAREFCELLGSVLASEWFLAGRGGPGPWVGPHFVYFVRAFVPRFAVSALVSPPGVVLPPFSDSLIIDSCIIV